MHDLHEADKIFKLVMKTAQDAGLRKITKINIKLGQIEEHGELITPENLIFNINLLARGTILESAEINIEKGGQGDYWELTDIEGDK